MTDDFVINIERETSRNTNFRKIIYTGSYMQLSLMSLLPGEDIGDEVHLYTDQFFRIEKGKGIVMIGDYQYEIEDGDAFIVPAGTKHNVKATETLKLYTIYSPPQHTPNLIQPKNLHN
jgi:mannose-6-phosphate isomerase-like protein (cupin superfamily)